MSKAFDPKKGTSKKNFPSTVRAKDHINYETIDAYFDRKADAAKKTLDRVGFPKELTGKK